MKDIFYLMEKTCLPYCKRFILFYLLLITLETLWASLTMEADISYATTNAIFVCSIIGFFIILWMHVRRFRQLMQGGGFTRILILPLHKRAFLWSELLFCLSTVVSFVCTQFVVWVLLFLLKSDTIAFETNQFMMALYTNTSVSLAPYTISECMSVLAIILFSTYLLVAIYTAFADVGRRVSFISFAVLLVLLLPFLLLMVNSIFVEPLSLNSYTLLGIFAIVLVPGIHRYLQHVFLMIRRKSK